MNITREGIRVMRAEEDWRRGRGGGGGMRLRQGQWRVAESGVGEEAVAGAVGVVKVRGSTKSKGRGNGRRSGKNERHWQRQEQGHGAADSPYNGQRDPRLWGTPGLYQPALHKPNTHLDAPR